MLPYVIDALNRRIGKKVGVGGATPVLEQAWLYKDGLHPIAELDGNGDVQSVFVYGVWPHGSNSGGDAQLCQKVR